ncbi:acanthoscurrin-2-like [Macrobrachium nipponense]|uniref:acanthoscurrin-2-like n=1 Tax=Macrobrachium nipponense TaxID=159736 RepID=UPI0030C7DAFF
MGQCGVEGSAQLGTNGSGGLGGGGGGGGGMVGSSLGGGGVGAGGVGGVGGSRGLYLDSGSPQHLAHDESFGPREDTSGPKFNNDSRNKIIIASAYLFRRLGRNCPR